MFIEVVNAKYISEYKILIEFNDGQLKIVDLRNELKGNVFKPLEDKDFFRNFTIRYNTIEWENGADFAPEFLYQIGKKVNKGKKVIPTN
jgi:hypothetical protein